MRTLPFLLLLISAPAPFLAGCQTEPTDPASPETTAPPEVEAAGQVEMPAPRRIDGAETTTRTVTLNQALADERDCFILAEEEGSSLMLLADFSVCNDASGMEGTKVNLTMEDAEVDVPLGGGSKTETVPLVVGVEPAR